MKRKIYGSLLNWKNSQERKPLMLYGARQVGKTYILKEFGQREYDNLLYINCFRNEAVRRIFDEDINIDRILMSLSALEGKEIAAGKTLIFLDEVQEVPSAVSALKYFYEQAPEIHIVVAGSLLGVLNLKGESYPVGKVDILHLYPMDFEEFLAAMGESGLENLLYNGENKTIDALGPKYIPLLRQYYFTGGMPEAVLQYSKTKDVLAVRNIQNNILSSYEADFAKHSGNQVQRIRQVWESLPQQLSKENKKFIYGAIRKGARANDYELAIQWLVDASILYKVPRVRDLKVPLKFYADNSAFKLYLLDVGLLGAMCDTPCGAILSGDNIFTEYKGAFTENFVLEQMHASDVQGAYYYSKDNSSLEVDFIIQCSGKVFPIEVKAEENVRSKSLRTLIDNEFKSYNLIGTRFSMKAHADQGWMKNIPLYAVDRFIRNSKSAF